MLKVMRELGHGQFSVVGHDRGSCVALRLTLDCPREVTTVTLLDGIPITEHLDRITDKLAIHYWHWFFFAQPEIPERVINADPDAWYHGDPAAMGAENYDEWRDATRKPGDPLAIWANWTHDLTGHPIDSGHHMAEEAPIPSPRLWRPSSSTTTHGRAPDTSSHSGHAPIGSLAGRDSPPRITRGRTCDCDLRPTCRHDHQRKQTLTGASAFQPRHVPGPVPKPYPHHHPRPVQRRRPLPGGG